MEKVLILTFCIIGIIYNIYSGIILVSENKKISQRLFFVVGSFVSIIFIMTLALMILLSNK